MTDEVQQYVHCINGHPLDESPSLPIPDRQPCPECGSLGRHHGLIASSTMRMYDHVKAKLQTRVEGKRRDIEMRTGWTPSHKYDGMVQQQRLVDPVKDRYLETIRTEDGTVVHHCDEPLSEHRGHGSAKFKKPKADSP